MVTAGRPQMRSAIYPCSRALIDCDRVKSTSSTLAPNGAFEGEHCVFIRLLIQQYLLSAYSVMMTVLSDRDKAANKTNRNIFSCAFRPSVCLLWRNVYFDLLPIFEWIKKMWYLCTMEYYSAIRKNELMLMHLQEHGWT